MDQTPDIAAPTGGKTHIIVQTPEVRVVEYVLQPGDSLAWHHHSEVTDRFYCLEGAIEVALRDPAGTRRLRPGDTLTIPPGVVHRSANAEPGISRYLLVQGVGCYDFVKAA